MSSKHLALPAADYDASAVATFPTLPQITCPFEPSWWAFRHTGTLGIVELSFNGTDVHARLELATDASSISMVGSDTKVWYRIVAAVAAGTATFEALAGQGR